MKGQRLNGSYLNQYPCDECELAESRKKGFVEATHWGKRDLSGTERRKDKERKHSTILLLKAGSRKKQLREGTDGLTVSRMLRQLGGGVREREKGRKRMIRAEEKTTMSLARSGQ